MLSFAGIPLTSGFIGKWAVFAAAWSGGAHWLVVVAVVISVVAAFFYVRVIVLMFFSEPRRAAPEVVRPGWPTLVALGVGAIATWPSASSPDRCWISPSMPGSSSAESRCSGQRWRRDWRCAAAIAGADQHRRGRGAHAGASEE